MTAQVWVTLVVGMFASAGVVGTLWQRQKSEAEDRALRREQDARAEWWRRYLWAVERAESDDPNVRSRGLVLLDVLAGSPLATASEADVLAAMGTMYVNSPEEGAS